MMDDDKLTQILKDHENWLSGKGGSRANLRGANLWGANLQRANLQCANLQDANLQYANLRGANLQCANLQYANLQRANLQDTCLDPGHLQRQRAFVRACPPLRTGGRIVYRTDNSQHVGSTEYQPGRTYVAPYLSFSAETACHPGIYAGSLEQIRADYPEQRLVQCYVRDGDWTICKKGIRCARLRVLSYVEEE